MNETNWEKEYVKLTESALQLHLMYKDKNKKYYDLKVENEKLTKELFEQYDRLDKCWKKEKEIIDYLETSQEEQSKGECYPYNDCIIVSVKELKEMMKNEQM